jgi:hypothetical protein
MNARVTPLQSNQRTKKKDRFYLNLLTVHSQALEILDESGPSEVAFLLPLLQSAITSQQGSRLCQDWVKAQALVHRA